MEESESFVIHVLPRALQGCDGLSTAVLGMTEELAKLNAIRVIMLGRKTWFERIGSLSFPQLSVESKYSMGTFGITPSIVSDFLTKNKNLSGVIHLHGMCSSFNLLLGASAKKSALPVIMHPHGMLMPWALRQHMLRKRIALSLFYRRHLSQVKAFIATSELEFEELRNFGLTQPVAVIPNGITLACTQEKKEKFDLMTNNSIRTALFLSRMAPVKGLEDLLNAWNSLKPHGWRLMLAGPDENGYLSKVLEMIRQLRLENSVEYVGVIQGHRKSEIFKRADLFVLPSYSENFGIVIAEALSAGLPVITTQSTQWKTLQDFECGFWTGTGYADLMEVMSIALSLPRQQLQEMGKRGPDCVKKYEWITVSNDLLKFYRWVSGQESRPEFVR